MTTLSASEKFDQVFRLHVKKLIEIDTTEGVLLEGSLLLDLNTVRHCFWFFIRDLKNYHLNYDFLLDDSLFVIFLPIKNAKILLFQKWFSKRDISTREYSVSLIGPFAQEDVNEGARIISLRMSHKSKKSIVRIDSIEIKKENVEILSSLLSIAYTRKSLLRQTYFSVPISK